MIRDSSEVKHEIMLSSASRSGRPGSQNDEPILFEKQVNILNREGSIRRIKVLNDIRSLSNGSSSKQQEPVVNIPLVRPNSGVNAPASRRNAPSYFMSADPKYLDDDSNYNPSTDFSVTLDFKKEFIRHKRVICSIKEFNSFDIQNKWDLAYVQAFNGHRQMPGEQFVNPLKKHTYFENYLVDDEMKESVTKILVQIGQT